MNSEELVTYPHSDNFLQDIEIIIENSRRQAYQFVDTLLVRRNWLLGRRIAEEELQGNGRAEYGLEIIKNLAKQLTNKYGKGFTKSNLYNFYLFYKAFPEIFHTVCGKSLRLLSWSHYRTLLNVHDSSARNWYVQEALSQAWSVRTLQRNIETQYYFRLLSSSNK